MKNYNEPIENGCAQQNAVNVYVRFALLVCATLPHSGCSKRTHTHSLTQYMEHEHTCEHGEPEGRGAVEKGIKNNNNNNEDEEVTHPHTQPGLRDVTQRMSAETLEMLLGAIGAVVQYMRCYGCRLHIRSFIIQLLIKVNDISNGLVHLFQRGCASPHKLIPFAC